MIVTYTDKSYRITYDGVSMIENALGNPNLIQISVVSGCSIIVAPSSNNTITYLPNGEFRSWELTGINTALARAEAHFIYARLRRTEKNALILFSINDYDFTGKIVGNETSEESTDYYYIKIGNITATNSLENPTLNRTITYDNGYLNTPQDNYDATRWMDAFKFYYEDPTDIRKVTKIKALADFYSEEGISCFGYTNTAGSGGGGASTLGQLINVGDWADTVPTFDRVMVQLKGATHWTEKPLSQLMPSLEEYAKKSDLNKVSNKLDDFLTGESLTDTIDNWREFQKVFENFPDSANMVELLKGKVDKTDFGSLFDKEMERWFMRDAENDAVYPSDYNNKVTNFFSKGGNSAMGYNAGTGSSGGGLIQTVYGYSDLGKSFDSSNYTDTFNAYTTNRMNDTITGIGNVVNTKVDKITGYGLSKNDFTDTLKSKLDSLSNYILPVAKTAVLGGIMIGSTLTASAEGVLNLPTTGVKAGTYTKFTTDVYGRITAGASLISSDIPALDISKITGLQDALDSKLPAATFNDMFEKVNVGTSSSPVYAVKVKYSFFSQDGVSAMGYNAGAGGGGLDEVLLWQILGNNGLEQIAKNHLTNALSGYATESWVTSKGYLIASTNDKKNWNEAYGWGNHANAGYATKTGEGASGNWDINVKGYSKSVLIGTSAMWADANNALQPDAGLYVTHQSSASNWGIISGMGIRLQRYPGDVVNNTQNILDIQSAYGDNDNIFIRKGFGNDTSIDYRNWYKLVHSGNYADYSPKLDGTGAKGDWSINITGNAATSDKFKNPINIWGQSLDGSGNVKGRWELNGTNQGSLSIYDETTHRVIQSYGAKPLFVNPVGNNVAIGVISLDTVTSNSSYALLVGGSTYISKNLKLGAANGTYIEIGKYRLEIDEANSSIKLYNPTDSTKVVNFYATGSVSSLGYAAGAGGFSGTLSALLDVQLTSLSDKDLLVYDSKLTKWKNISQSSITPDLSNYVTTNTAQIVSGYKTFTTGFGFNGDNYIGSGWARGMGYNSGGVTASFGGYGTSNTSLNNLYIGFGSSPWVEKSLRIYSGSVVTDLLTSVKSLVISDTNGIAHINFSRDDFNYLVAPGSNSSISFVVGAAPSYADSTLVINSKNVHSRNNSILGSTTYRWNGIYSTVGNFNGQITSLVAKGTSPFVVASDTMVTNLNANYVGGVDADSINHLYTIGSRKDYQYTFIPLFKESDITYHRINGKIYTTQNGASRYAAADIDIWYSRWSSSGGDSRFKVVNYGQHDFDLVTATWNGATWWGLRHTSDQAVNYYFLGTKHNVDLNTLVPYYTRNTGVVLNSEVNNSITDQNKQLGTIRILGGSYNGSFVGNLEGNVTGNSDTATKLETARNIFGKSFDGSGNVTGGAKFLNICIETNNSGVDTGRGSEINNYNGNLYLQHDTKTHIYACYGGGNFGIGTITPAYKLHVSGDIYAQNGWMRTSGDKGWYSQDYEGGIYMKDTDYIRTYGGKRFYVDNTDGTNYSTSAAISTAGGIFAIKDISTNANLLAKGNLTLGTSDKTYINIGPYRLEVDITNSAVKLYNPTTPSSGVSFYTTGGNSAMGYNAGAGTGGSDYNRLDNWSDYTSDKAGYVLSAKLGYDVNTRLNTLENNGALTFVKSGEGRFITDISKTGTTVTYTKGEVPSIYTDDYRALKPNVFTNRRFTPFLMGGNNLGISTSEVPYLDAIFFSSYGDKTAGGTNLLAFSKSDGKMYHSYQAFGATGWGTPVQIIDANGGTFTGDITMKLSSDTSTITRRIVFNSIESDAVLYAMDNRLSFGYKTGQGVNVGNLLVSNAWADKTNVPTNGIYCKGAISCASTITTTGYVTIDGWFQNNLVNVGLYNRAGDARFRYTSATEGWESDKPIIASKFIGVADSSKKLYNLGSQVNWSELNALKGNGIVKYLDTTTSGRWVSYATAFQFSNVDNPIPGTSGHWITQIIASTSYSLGVRYNYGSGWNSIREIVTRQNASYLYGDTKAGWVRIAYFNYNGASASWSGTFHLTNNYYNNQNEGVIFNVTTNHNNTPVITQIGGGSTLFTAVRVLRNTSSTYNMYYLDVYYNSSYAPNTIYVSYVSNAPETTRAWTLNSSFVSGGTGTNEAVLSSLGIRYGLGTTHEVNAYSNIKTQGNFYSYLSTDTSIYSRIGPQSKMYCYYETNAEAGHYFNNNVVTNGSLYPYKHNTYACGVLNQAWNSVRSYKYILGNKNTAEAMITSINEAFLDFASNGNEMVFTGNNASLYINYRASSTGRTMPSTWYWKAGSSDSWANFNLGSLGVYGTVNATGSISTSGSLNVPYLGGSWLSMTTNNALIGSINTTTDKAHVLYRVRSFGNDVVAFGGLGNFIGFHGFFNKRTENGYDWRTAWNTATGDLYHEKNLLVGSDYADGRYIQIGTIRIVMDYANNALKIMGINGTAANLSVTGSSSALGYSAGQSSGVLSAVYTSSSLGNTFSDSDTTNTFNAYAVSSVHKRVEKLENFTYTLDGDINGVAAISSSTGDLYIKTSFKTVVDNNLNSINNPTTQQGLYTVKYQSSSYVAVKSAQLLVNSDYLHHTVGQWLFGNYSSMNGYTTFSNGHSDDYLTLTTRIYKYRSGGGGNIPEGTWSKYWHVFRQNCYNGNLYIDNPIYSKSIIPQTGWMYDLGTSSYPYSGVYADTCYLTSITSTSENITILPVVNKNLYLRTYTGAGRIQLSNINPTTGQETIAMVIHNGRVVIANSLPNVNYNFEVYVGNSRFGGNIYYTGALSPISSDKRLKKNENFEVDYCQRLLDLGMMFDYEYNDEAKKAEIWCYDENVHTGLYHHNVKKAFPSMALQESGYGAVDYMKTDYINTIAGALQLNILAVRSITERTKSIEDQLEDAKQEINRLNNRVKELEEKQ